MTETLMSLRDAFERWMDSRDYFRTGPGVIMGVTDVLFYLAFAFCFAWDFLGTTMFKSLYTDTMEAGMEGIYFFALFMAALCGIVAMVLRFRAHLVVINVILVASAYIQWAEGGRKLFLLALCVMIAGSSDRSFRVISYIALIEGAVIMAAAYLASQMDIITDLVYEGGRHSFGIVYCTDCAAHIFFLMGVYAMLRLDSFGLIDYLVFVFLLTFMMMTKAKTDIACSVLVLAGIAVSRFSARIKWNRIKWGRALKKAGRVVGAFLCFSFMICAAFSFGLSLLQDLTDPITRRRIYTIDYTLLRRMELNRDALLAHPFTLFGTKMRQKGFGGKTEGLPGWDEYNFIDCSYVRIYVLGGAILFVLLLAILTYVMLRCYKNRRYFFIFILSIVALVSMIEHHLPEYYYNLFPMMAFTGGGIYRRKAIADADSRSKPDQRKKGKKGNKKRDKTEMNMPDRNPEKAERKLPAAAEEMHAERD